MIINKIYISTIIIFWTIVAFFILTTYLSIFSMYLTSYGFYSYLPLLPFFVGGKFLFVMLIQAFLGMALIILTSMAKFTKILKVFLIITGSSAACISFSIISISSSIISRCYWEYISCSKKKIQIKSA